jgi:LAO/AO transport system kinase
VRAWRRCIIAEVSTKLESDRFADTALAQMVERLRAGDVRALARAISVVEGGLPGASELLAACRASSEYSLRIGVTGPPGAGKSTLVDQMARRFRQQGKTVAVLAVDPTSPYTGGALLGDRIRMQDLAGDEGVYVRSVASRGATGGVTRTAVDICAVMAAAGRQVVLIETVGVGQDEVEVVQLANVTVVVLVPGMGDDVQSMKAGLIEVADIFVVNKSDAGGAERVEAEIHAMQGLAGEEPGVWMPPVVRTVATTGEGVEALMESVRLCALEKQRTGRRQVRRLASEGLRLDHLGIAVRSIAAARGFYEMLGLRVANEETVEHEKVKTAMLPLGETRIELLEPTEEESAVGRFLAKRGEGLHHIALHVEGIDEVFNKLKAEGIRLASDAVRVGAGGHRYFFVHPTSTGGVLVELVENAAEDDA